MSLSAEIKDFLDGYKTVSSIMGDAEDRKIRKDAAKRAADKDEAAEMEDYAADAETYLSPSKLAAAKRAPKSTSGAIPVSSADIIAPYGDMDDEPPVQMASGGVVPGEDEGEKPQAIPTRVPVDNAAAAKARAAGAKSYSAGNQQMPLKAMNGKDRNTYGDEGAAPAADDGSGMKRSQGPGLKAVFASADKAISAAMQGFRQQGGEKKGALPTGKESDVDFMSGKGAATPEEIKAIDTKIDPDGSMEPWAKGRARLGYAYEYFISKGQPEKAANVAQRILLFDKMASQARGKIAVQLISGGQAEKGASVLVDAYNDNIHDGSTLEVQPMQGGQFGFKVMKDGEVVQEGAGSAADLAALAGNVANGSEWTRRTARIAAGSDTGAPPADGAPPAPAYAQAGAIPPDASAPAGGAPAVAAPAAPPAGAPAADTPPAAQEAAAPAAKKPGKRDITWAKKQYTHAASVLKSWEDEVAKNPTPENQARLKDAQIRLGEAEQDAATIRMSTVRSKTADQSQILLKLDEDMAKWREAAEPLGALPPPPKDGLRGAKPAEGAIPATAGAPAAPAAPQGQGGEPKYTPKSGWSEGGWSLGYKTYPEAQLKPTPPEIATQAKAALAAGKPRGAVLRMLLENGYNPSGL